MPDHGPENPDELSAEFTEASSNVPPEPIESLDGEAVLFWEVRAKDALLSRSLLARLFPQMIRSEEMLQDLLGEERSVRPFFSALLHLAFRILRIILITALAVFGIFSLFWYIASLSDHARAYSLAAYGVALLLTVFAIVDAVTMLLMNDPLYRDRKMVRIRLCGFLSLPFLMYATACPTTSEFVIEGAKTPPGFWDWALFYGYMLLDVVALGFPQGVFGDPTAFLPKSPMAGLHTFWAKSIMLVGVVAVIFATIRRILARTYTFEGTVKEFREWSKFRFGMRWDETKPKTVKYWIGRLFGGIRNRNFEISVRARALPFSKLHNPISLHEFQEFRYPEWTVDQEGRLSCKDLEKKRERVEIRRQAATDKGSRKADSKTPLSKGTKKLLFKILAFFFSALLVLLLAYLTISLPGFYLFHKGFHLEVSSSVVVALLVGISIVWLDMILLERRKSLQVVTLSQVKAHALTGRGAVPSKDIIRILNSNNKGLTHWVGIAIGSFVLWPVVLLTKFLNWKNKRTPIPKEKKKRLPKDTNFYEWVAQDGGLKLIFDENMKTAWLFHHQPFRYQGRLKYLYRRPPALFSLTSSPPRKAALFALPDSGLAEQLDTLPSEETNGFAKCELLIAMLVEDGKPPSKPEHVQELKCLTDYTEVKDIYKKSGKTEAEVNQMFKDAYRYSGTS